MGGSAQDGVTERVFLGLGANLGDREARLGEALSRLRREGIKVVARSSLYETEPLGFLEQPYFLNAVVEVETRLQPHALLRGAKRVEHAMGRRPSFRNAPRPIDVDLLLYGSLVLEGEELSIPHPRLAERAFVLVPLSELAPALVHPVLGATVWELLERVGGKEGVLPRGRALREEASREDAAAAGWE